ncbi:MAG: TIR domain-containing protein, partial [Novosphingobium sp.]
MASPDIFLSYNREDQAVASRFADAFAVEGLNVWWDTALRSGEAYDEVTEAALRTAKAVVVLWSPRSVASRWVRAEATIADRCKTLVPVMIEACERPIMFELTQTADLTHWTGDAGDPAWRGFLSDLQRFVGHEPRPPQIAAPQTAAPAKAQRGRPGLAIAPLHFAAADETFAQGLIDETATIFSRFNYALTLQSEPAGARYILEATLRRADQRVRLSAKLIETESGTQIWAERIDADGDDPFAVQEDVASRLASKAVLAIEAAERRWALARPNEASGAYYGMIAGLQAFSTFSAKSHRHALDVIEVALADNREDPYLLTFASACCSALLLLRVPGDRDKLRLASQDYSRRALLTGDDDPLVLGWLAWAGIQSGGDLAMLDAMAERARSRNPGWTMGWSINGHIKAAMGQLEPAIACYHKALELEPRGPDRWGSLNMLGCCKVLAGQFEEALAPLKESQQLVPGAPYNALGLVAAYVHLGRIDEAREMRKQLAADDADVDLDLLRTPAHQQF